MNIDRELVIEIIKDKTHYSKSADMKVNIYLAKSGRECYTKKQFEKALSLLSSDSLAEILETLFY